MVQNCSPAGEGKSRDTEKSCLKHQSAGAESIAQLIEYLPSMQKVLSSIPSTT